MKTFLLTFLISFSSLFAFAQNSNPNGAKFKFVEETHDFGVLKEGADATYDFTFVNTGKEPLVINNCVASCGCTVPTWPKEPIMPGSRSKITVKFNTQGKNGMFVKSIYIQSNAICDKDRYEIFIKGSVTPTPASIAVPAVDRH
jgi:Protein of unknown function (DUF1573)